jgi:hypothetical protein
MDKDKLDKLIEEAQKLGRLGVCWGCGIYRFVRFGEEDTELGRCSECGRPFFED